jgi:hypothetical protein
LFLLNSKTKNISTKNTSWAKSKFKVSFIFKGFLIKKPWSQGYPYSIKYFLLIKSKNSLLEIEE